MRKLPLWVRTVLFTLLFPGTVVGFTPWLLLWLSAGAWPLGLAGLGWIGWALLVLGALGYLLCALRFGREGQGTPAPWDAPRNLVGGGLYRWVRNPMYVSLVSVLLGVALACDSGVLLAYAVFIWLLFHLRVVRYEEPVLAAQFGQPFRAYCERVPRWLPRRPRDR